MDIDYLYSIVDLYLKKEKDNKRTYLNIKKLDDHVEFSFSMKNETEDKTESNLSYEDFNARMLDFLTRFKEDLMIIDEKYDCDSISGKCKYFVLFNNGRSISFNGFGVLEMNILRNILYNININQNEIRVNEIDKKKEMVYQPRLRLQQAGFSSFATIFLIAIFFVGILVIALWVFQSL